ncbi:TetR/AcrR family transcriptional regulator [Actinomadura sp. KC345]|uniref:TetR/AcrR family transcriptional regulator n=1 Tax=Actinomadura sp. KC345 TaxID=2530371 RepID=UPI0014049194|nr:TetR/AcrR family transcriptional regulator [Actinomadura sp. KC345]
MGAGTGERVGLRERKKMRTRRLLIETGLRSFAEKGYEATTVADICAVAKVAPATFYAYFPAKQDLVFADGPERVEALLRVIAGRRPDESLHALLMRGVERFTVDRDWTILPDEDLIAIRAELVFTVPALRAVALGQLLDAQAEWSEALARAFPEVLDEPTAHAVIGSLVGAVIGGAVAHLRRGAPLAQLPAAVMRAAETALNGLPQDPGRTAV